MDCHELLGGPLRSKTVLMPSCWVFLCRPCHQKETSCPDQASLIRLLAVKMWADYEHFNPTEVIKLWRPKCQQSLVDEIIAAVSIEFNRIMRECT
jgi:hypothetical protein